MKCRGQVHDEYLAVNKQNICPSVQIEMHPAALMQIINDPFELPYDLRPELAPLKTTKVLTLKILDGKGIGREPLELSAAAPRSRSMLRMPWPPLRSQ